MWGEDAEALNLTENTQPALMAVSVAVAAYWKNKAVFNYRTGAYVASHSWVNIPPLHPSCVGIGGYGAFVEIARSGDATRGAGGARRDGGRFGPKL